VKQLKGKTLKPEDFPTIRIVEYNGKLYTLDDRRLTTFIAADVEKIPFQKLDINNPEINKEFLKKFKPINDVWTNIIVDKKGRSEARRIAKEYGKYE
jgi:hypothetical protein